MIPQQYPLPTDPSAPPPYTTATNFQDTNEERMRKFQNIVGRYEINREFATRLRELEGYEIVFIVDGKKMTIFLFFSFILEI